MESKPWGIAQWLILLAVLVAIGVVTYVVARRFPPWEPPHGIVRPDQVQQ